MPLTGIPAQGVRVRHAISGRIATIERDDCVEVPSLERQGNMPVVWEGTLGHVHEPLSEFELELADWENELLSPSDPVAMTDEQYEHWVRTGETLPPTPVVAPPPPETFTIPVEHTRNSRISIFNDMGYGPLLMDGLDPENWNNHMTTLQEQLAPMQWTVTEDDLRLDSVPSHMAFGYRQTVDDVYLENVQEFLRSASRGRIQLAQASEDDARRYRLKMMSNLADEAWLRYAGNSNVMICDKEPNNDTRRVVRLSSLRVLLSSYTQYMNDRATRRSSVQAVMRERMATSVAARNPVIQPTPGLNLETAQRLGKFLTKVKSNLQVERDPFLQLPILPHKTLSSRPWGIEIEAPHINGMSTPEHWELKEDGSLRSLGYLSLPARVDDPRYNGTLPEEETQISPPRQNHDSDCDYYSEDEDCNCGYWDEQEHGPAPDSDGTYSIVDEDTETGEYNSPVLRSYHSRGLKYLTAELEHRRTNNSAGVHVHVSAADLTPEQAIRLSMIYSALEPLFESEYKRGTTRTYCKSVDAAEMINRFNQMREVKKQGLPATQMRFNARYWTVNLAALSSHGTVEFRAMGPIYNYEHLIRWGYFCRELVNIAKADVSQKEWSKVRTIRDVVTLFSKYGKETPTPSWAEPENAEDLTDKIVKALGTENRRVPHVRPLSENSDYNIVNDDYSNVRTRFEENQPSSW